MYGEFNATYISCIIDCREVHAEAVSVHFPMYLDLGEYVNGPCLHSLQVLKTLQVACCERCGATCTWLTSGCLKKDGIV